MLFGICPSTSRTPKFRNTYVITYGDFMVIVEAYSLPQEPQAKSLKLPKTIHKTMKQTENLKRKLKPVRCR